MWKEKFHIVNVVKYSQTLLVFATHGSTSI